MDETSAMDPDARAQAPEGGEPSLIVAALWQRLRRDRDANARAALIEHYRPFARKVAAMLYGRRIDDDIVFDDYHQWALLGMI